MQCNEGSVKFTNADEKYFNFIKEVEKMNFDTKEIIYNFPVFVGQVNIARHLFIYDLYKNIKDLSGNIADVGTYKGASFLFGAKLLKLFEPMAQTQIHGFDWFGGMDIGKNDNSNYQNTYTCNYEILCHLIKLQDLEDVAVLHKLDLTKELNQFMEDRPYLRFKMVFIDCGLEAVLEESIKLFWDRLVNGGIMVLDHYNNEGSPTESNILEKYIGKNIIRQASFVRNPSAYIIKE